MSTLVLIILGIVILVIWAVFKLIKWLFGSLSRSIRSSRPSSSYSHTAPARQSYSCSFQYGISERKFEYIVLSVAKSITRKRLHDIRVKGSNVYGAVRPQSGISEWKFRIDFNDYGHLTGRYWISSDNYDSEIPEVFASRIAEIIQNDIERSALD